MKWDRLGKLVAAASVVAAAVWTGPPRLPASEEEATKVVSVADCSFQVDPGEFLSRQARAREVVFERLEKMGRAPARSAAGPATVPASEIPRRNVIDEEIFGLLEKRGVRSARLAGDEEFLRRVMLDLTGRIPSPNEVRDFVADSSGDKRNAAIDRLLYSPEFVDRWTMWFGDLLQNTQNSSNIARQMIGRNTYHDYIRNALIESKSIRDLAYEVTVGRGNVYYTENGAANWGVGANTPMGPVQDTFDTMLSKTASTFLGLSHYDCLLCHDGRRHLDQLSLWARDVTRLDSQRMAAFFSRMRLTRAGNQADPLYNSYTVVDQPTGTYDLNTNFGNRPNRTLVGSLRSLTPQYRDSGATPSDANWRVAFAENMIRDPMLARNLANRFWKTMFNLALAEPVDSLDPARLDPRNPPPDPWTLQATHPELLEQLATKLAELNYDLREFLRLLAQSSAYQLSSKYEGEWKLEYVPLFARHYPRRLEGEEVHDAIVKATGVFNNYTVGGWSETVRWACQLPEPVEPRSNGAAAAFMNTFFRGNRDTAQRNQSGSILQQLSLMNDRFVLDRTRVAASPELRRVTGLTGSAPVVEELFLLFLSRMPSELERSRAMAALDRATTTAARNTVIEDLAWALINKVEFVFSY